MANESSYAQTPVGAVELKDLPAARAIETVQAGDYFSESNRAFGVLFRYIKANDLAMTVPVEAEMAPARMRFFVEREVTRDLPSNPTGVTVLDMPARKVVSTGLRGSYTRQRFEEGVARLREWLAARPEWAEDGEPYAVYWNGPFVPGPFKRSEVHIRVVPR